MKLLFGTMKIFLASFDDVYRGIFHRDGKKPIAVSFFERLHMIARRKLFVNDGARLLRGGNFKLKPLL